MASTRSDSTGSDSGTSSTSAGESSGSTVAAESSSTGEPSFCNGEPLSEDAWCHTPVDFDIAPMEATRILAHTTPRADGGTSLLLFGVGGPEDAEAALQDVFQEFVVDPSEARGYRLTGFGVEPWMGSTSRLTPVRIFTDASGRHDYLPQGIGVSCIDGPVVASPERAAEFRPTGAEINWAPKYGFERCIRALFSPIALAGEVVDAFFYYCDVPGGAYCLSIDPEPQMGWPSWRRDMAAVQQLPAFDCPTPLDGPIDLVVGHFLDPESETIVLLPRPCEGEDLGGLRTVEDAGGGRVAWGLDIPLAAFADLDVQVLRVADLNQDGFDDLLLLGDQVMGVMFGGAGGFSEPQNLAASPFVLPYFETEMPVGGLSHLYQPNVRVGAGQFDETPELELVVRVEDGVQVLSLDGTRSLVLEAPASDFAIADVDADGIDDLALLTEVGTYVRVFLSAPPPT